VIDAANSDVAPTLDAEGNARVDDPGTPNTGAGVYRFYDMGAFEFLGSSSDIVPPTVVSILPFGASGNPLSDARFSTFTIHFSKPLQPLSAQSLSLYSLVEAGPDGLLGTTDDVPIQISSISYTPGSQDVSVNLNGQLPQGIYRLTLISGANGAIVDQSGNALDGDGNGIAGGNFVRDFRLDLTAPIVGSVTPNGPVGTGPTRFTVVFQENLQMDATTITNVANYSLFSTILETFGTPSDVDESVRITGVTYDATTKTATINLSGPLASRRYELIVRSTITDQAGNAIAGGVNYLSFLQVGVPVLTPIADKSVYDGSLLTFTATAADPDNVGTLSFNLGPGAPAGAAITSNGVFTWTPTAAQAGSVYNIRVIVTDQDVPPLTASQTFAVTVLPNLPPVVVSTTINNSAAQRSWIGSLTFQFSDNVSGTLTTGNTLLTNVTTGATIPTASIALTYNTATNQAVITFPGLAGQSLPDGNYLLTLLAAGITGSHGKPMAANYTFSFFALAGDANGDRVVNDADLYAVWRELQKPAASRNLADDLNGDGQVTQADLDLVRAHYLATLAPPPVSVVSASVNDGQAQRSRVFDVVLQFSGAANLNAASVTLWDVNSGTAVSGLALTFDPATNRARLTFPGLANQQLPDGNYELVVLASRVTDALGRPLAVDFHFTFFALTGDVNGDRAVNDADIYSVWQELLKPAASRNLNYDLNGDGQVTQADLGIVSAHYLATLTIPQVTVVSASVNDGLAQRSRVFDVVLQFSAPVTLTASSVVLWNVDTGVSVSGLALSFDPTTDRAKVTFPGLPNQQLPDGNYEMVVLASRVTDTQGRPMATDFHFAFFALSGDVNGDRVVNDADVYAVYQQLLLPAASRNLNFDLNGDGQVTQADLDIVRAHYLTTLPAPALTVVTSTVNSGQAQRSRVFNVLLQFNGNVSASLSAADLTLTNLDTRATVTGFAVAFDASLYLATVTFPGLANQQLPDGNYELVVLGAGVTDASNSPMAADFHFRFFALTGDANGDRVVNDLDLYQVWQELLKPAGTQNLNSDLNGDGQVTSADVAIVKSHYLATLAAPAAAFSSPMRSPVGALAVQTSVFTPINSSAQLTGPSPAFSQALAATPQTTPLGSGFAPPNLWSAARDQGDYPFAQRSQFQSADDGTPTWEHLFGRKLWLKWTRKSGHML